MLIAYYEPSPVFITKDDMVLKNLFSSKEEPEETISEEGISEERVTDKKIEGKIFHLSEKGWGFISSQEIEFTRIFFHWTGLDKDTMHFNELRRGMKVEFNPVHIKQVDEETGKEVGWRAIKIKVIEER
jgi:cold shock CspA family protein